MSVLTNLSDKAYWAMRKAMVLEVYQSKTKTISEVAARHKVSTTTLWKWCNEDLGPNQRKWLTEKSHKIRGQRISASNKPVISDAAVKKDMTIIMTKNKPWDKKKARALLVPSTSPNVPPGTLEVHQDIRSLIQAVKPTARKQGATVVLNIDEHGKFLKYEVTGDVSVQVFTRA